MSSSVGMMKFPIYQWEFQDPKLEALYNPPVSDAVSVRLSDAAHLARLGAGVIDALGHLRQRQAVERCLGNEDYQGL